MKKYPSISRKPDFDIPLIGFDKLDGSNIRAFWTKKAQAFTEFGTRTLKLTANHKYLGGAIALIRNKYEKALNAIFINQGYQEVTAFFEFFGKKSFAGRHELTEPKDVILIDLMIYKKGLIHPNIFVQLFGHLDIPTVVHQGKLTDHIVTQIEQGELSGMTYEGVVFKGRGGKKGNYPIAFKIKNKAWINDLKTLCGEDEALFNKLK